MEARTRQSAVEYIPGVYNYCDSWCRRCAFTARCRVFTPKRPNLGEFLEHSRRPLAMEDEARIDTWIKRQRTWVAAHPLAKLGREYADAAASMAIVLETIQRDSSDEVVRLAVDAIQHFAHLIPAKTIRALSSLAIAADDRENVDTDRMADANGSARVTRLGIAESSDAWRVLSAVGVHDDDVPAAMIAHLSELDAALASAFPGADTFKRPGFDDEPRRPSDA